MIDAALNESQVTLRGNIRARRSNQTLLMDIDFLSVIETFEPLNIPMVNMFKHKLVSYALETLVYSNWGFY